MLRVILAKLITKAQKLLLRSNLQMAVNLYYYLAKKHFRLLLDKDLEEEALNNTDAARMAARRHSRLVLKVLYKDSSVMTRKIARYGSRGSFIKNIILGAKL